MPVGLVRTGAVNLKNTVTIPSLLRIRIRLITPGKNPLSQKSTPPIPIPMVRS
jgi:hypothetical protein